MQHFDGTLLIVSQRSLYNFTGRDSILAVEDKQLVLYNRDYKWYMEKNAALMEELEALFIPSVTEIKSAPKIIVEEPIERVDKKQKRKKNFGARGLTSGRTREMNATLWNK